MPLKPGVHIGPYEVVSLLGAGGMGEVYRARDPKLGRDVAIKVLPQGFAAEPDRLQRFEREARLLAAINHPYIASIYGAIEHEGSPALVLELVEGPTLAEHLRRGPMPVDEAIHLSRQIAAALDAAHEQGIIHRDLKPANIKIAPDGTVKVLDFGLAKAILPEDSPAAVLSNSPTITSPAAMTAAGVLLGTAAYMSPEQAKGKPADKRSDIWAFGCVLYEMLTGRRAFEGDDVSDTLANVLKSHPDWNALPLDTPPAIRVLLERCVERERTRRVPNAGTILFTLDEAQSFTGSTAPQHTAASPRRRWVPLALATVAGAVVTALAVGLLSPSAPPSTVVRLSISTPQGDPIPTAQGALAVSPDGTRIIYVADGRFYLRELSRFDAEQIPLADNERGVHPVFSPDGQSFAYASGGTVKRVAITGGAPVTVCTARATVFGMTWDVSGIVIGRGRDGIVRCAGSGPPEQLVKVDAGQEAYGPQILPGGTHLLFTIAAEGTGRERWNRERWDRAQIVVQSLASSERKVIIEAGSDARYLPSGHLVYAVSGVVFAVPFDASTHTVRGEPVPALEGVRRTIAGTTGIAHFATSDAGTAVYLPGPARLQSVAYGLGIAARDGSIQPLQVEPRQFTHVRVSPDGSRMAVGTDDGREAVIWIYTTDGSAAPRRLTLGGNNRYPVWAPDNRRVAFQSDRDGDHAMFVQSVDGTVAQRLTNVASPELSHTPESWSLDGHLLFSVQQESRYTLDVLRVSDNVRTALAIESVEPLDAVFSPDGRWIAYASTPSTATNAPGRGIFVEPFPATGTKYSAPKVNIDYQPVWSRDGRELIYVASVGLGQMAAVRVTPGSDFTFGNPVTFPAVANADRLPDFGRAYDTLVDGRLIGPIPEGGPETRRLTDLRVVMHWFDELRRVAPPR